MVEVVKLIMFLLPFFKELFLGKSAKKASGDNKTTQPVGKTTASSFLITIVVASVVCNFFLFDRLFIISGKLAAARKQTPYEASVVIATPLEIPIVPLPILPNKPIQKPIASPPRDEHKSYSKRISCKNGSCRPDNRYSESHRLSQERLKQINEIK